MIYAVSEKITNFFAEKGYIDSSMIDVYRYGFEIIVSSVLGMFAVIIIGIALSSAIESILFLICLIFLRRYTGGYHASSYLKCNLTLVCSYILSLVFYSGLKDKKDIFIVLIAIMFLPSFYVIIKYSPVENIHKSITYEEKKTYKINSVVLFLIYYMFSIILTSININLGMFVFIVTSLVIVAIIIEIVKQRLINYEKKCFKSNA